MPDVKIDSLGKFMERVGELRRFWEISEGKELWFRGGLLPQRSRFMVFGTDPAWMAEEYNRPESTIRTIED